MPRWQPVSSSQLVRTGLLFAITVLLLFSVAVWSTPATATQVECGNELCETNGSCEEAFGYACCGGSGGCETYHCVTIPLGCP